jgi:hypothetical protein
MASCDRCSLPTKGITGGTPLEIRFPFTEHREPYASSPMRSCDRSLCLLPYLPRKVNPNTHYRLPHHRCQVEDPAEGGRSHLKFVAIPAIGGGATCTKASTWCSHGQLYAWREESVLASERDLLSRENRDKGASCTRKHSGQSPDSTPSPKPKQEVDG